MSKIDLSKKYAKALFAICKESGSVAKMHDQLKEINKILCEPDVARFLKDPNTPVQNKKEAIARALKTSGVAPELASFVGLLIERKRTSLLSEIVNVFESTVDSDGGLTRGIVKSAKPLTKESIEALEAKISNILNRKIVLTAKEEPAMIAGVVAKVGGWTFDDSLDTHLKKLNEKLLNY